MSGPDQIAALETFGKEVFSGVITNDNIFEKIDACRSVFDLKAEAAAGAWLTDVYRKLKTSMNPEDYCVAWLKQAKDDTIKGRLPTEIQRVVDSNADIKTKRTEIRRFISKVKLGAADGDTRFWVISFNTWCNDQSLNDMAGANASGFELVLADISLISVLLRLTNPDVVNNPTLGVAKQSNYDDDEADMIMRLSRLQGPDAEDARRAVLRQSFMYPSQDPSMRYIRTMTSL